MQLQVGAHTDAEGVFSTLHKSSVLLTAAAMAATSAQSVLNQRPLKFEFASHEIITPYTLYSLIVPSCFHDSVVL